MKKALSGLFIFFTSHLCYSQDKTTVLSADMFHTHQRLFLAPLDGWVFKQGHDPSWAKEDIDLKDWKKFNLTELNAGMKDASGRVEGWFRIKIKLDSSFKGMPLGLSRDLWAATDIYLDGKLIHAFGNTGNPYKAYNSILKYPVPVDIIAGKEYLLAIHFVDYETTFTQREIRLKPHNLQSLVNITGPEYVSWVIYDHKLTHIYGAISISVSFLLFFLFWLLVFLNPGQRIFWLIAISTTFVLIAATGSFWNTFFEITYPDEKIRYLISVTTQPIMTVFGMIILEWVLLKRITRLNLVIIILMIITSDIAHIFSISAPFGLFFMVMISYLIYLIIRYRKNIQGAPSAIVAGIVLTVLAAFAYITLHKNFPDLYYEYEKPLLSLTFLGAPLLLMVYISIRFKEILKSVSDEAEKVLKITEEKKELLADQNILLEKQVNERTAELKTSLENLKATQWQLIQSEKMASLGELTAGIAHEIQNPLNFVNNFSEVSVELIEELAGERSKEDGERDTGLENELLSDISENLRKISHHGKRADAIVKGMLQHSRSSNGTKEQTDINALTDEYLRLAYHGLRAKDKSFNAALITGFDERIGKIELIPQEMGRVILNLITNAFYAVTERKRQSGDGFEPQVSVITAKSGNKVEIRVSDNGNGIPDSILDKIFQPFFTTKPTGLGLSLAYDIVKAHGGELKVETKNGEGTTFIISIPGNE
jgi:two-component system NtrC family sensor kinase